MESLVNRTYAAYADQFGGKALGVAIAPGRLNIIGEHTDYNDGFVLPMAIDRYVAVAFGATTTRNMEIWSEHAGDMTTVSLADLGPEGVPNWVRYASGMAWALDHSGYTCQGVRLAVCSSLPVGAGVSSSAAFEIAVGTAIAASMKEDVQPQTMAELAHKSDHDFVGIPSGIMDQFASACCIENHALLLDCRDRSFEHVHLGSETAFVVIDTGKRRELVEGEYAQRVASCRRAVAVLEKSFPEVSSLRDCSRLKLEEIKLNLDEQTYRHARHVVTEMIRPSEFVKASAAKDWLAAGRLMYDSHESLASDYAVSCPELDTAVDIASQHAACYGARLTGAGFGGCAIALVASSAVDDVVEHIERGYREIWAKGMAYSVRASRGVRVVF